MNIARNLERSQQLFPNKTAIVFEESQISYQELNAMSNQIANGLAQYGIGRGDCVALFLPNIPAFISSYFAIQKLGAVAVTLNSNFKAQETNFILNDCQAKIVITTAALRNQLLTENLPRIKQVFIAEGEAEKDVLLADLMAQSSPIAEAIDLNNDEPAAVIYSSGTTGFPKGIVLSQGNIISTVQTTTDVLGMNADDRVLLCLPAFHNYGQYATFNPCMKAAATLVLHRKFEIEPIIRSIVDDSVTVFFGVPTLYTLLYNDATVIQLASLRRCISAGAPLSVEMSDKWQAKFGLVINQIYGLTECSMVCFNHVSNYKAGTLGSPVEGTELKIVDDCGQTVSTGEPGEIVVRSPSVMLGYLNLPEETITAIKDGWFHTGDVGRFDEDGYVYLIDRSKDMINVGGEKVYPAEVEQVLSQHLAVAEVAVYGTPESLMGEQVNANIILKAGQKVSVETLINFCRNALANYKVPSVIQFVESLPKNKTGKVLKRVLREESQSQSNTLAHSSKTPDELRTWLSHWLQKNLALENPGEFSQSFNDYGLTSLLAVTLVLELNEWLGTSFEPLIIWNYSTIDKLVAYLTDVQKITIQSNVENATNTNEPIAIIGLGCRFPGEADTPDKFWDILKNGVDTVTDIPANRWDIEHYYDANPNALGKMYMREGAFLKEVDKFDAAFFGISALEARSLDPQQRLLLEICWEALENAGIAASELRNSQTGVFIGSMQDDYTALNMYQDIPENIDAYKLTSSLRSMNAGRLSYVFQLHGPAMQVDAACSSSLLSIHLACQSLRSKESNLAIAGGVTLFLSPESLIGLSRSHAVAPDGRTKAFAANADGFGVGEGAGTVILKRLSDAQRDGDRILAVIKGSAVNHDGPSNGLTAPNGLAQEAVLRQALKNAAITPDQIDYIETHGTGTPLGDPIEVEALNQVFAPNRSHPLMIGSVKTNIGHLCGAAGIASLAKVILSLQHNLVPASLHFNEPNPHISWGKIPFVVPTKSMNWSQRPKLAGVSSFGMSGTNVHLIIGEAPEILISSDSTLERPCHLLTLSGKTEQALKDQITRYTDYLSGHSALNIADICYTANTGRVHFEHRLAITAKDLNELKSKLTTAKNNHVAPLESQKTAFLFTGQGSQYVDMGRELYDTQPLFRQILVRCDAILRAYLEIPLLDVLYPADKTSQNLDQTCYTQPVLFVLEYALAKLWQSWGVEPEVLIGHSVGEFAAACLAGVFSLEDGLKLIAERGRLMQALPQNGSMVAVQCSESVLMPLLEPYREQVSIACFNAPQSLVISGEATSIEKIINQLEKQAIQCNRLAVSHAFHSPLMKPMLAKFEQVARSITYHAPRFKLISNISGDLITEINADYWVNHVEQAVHFTQGMATIAALGVNVFIEVGAKPTLLGLGQLSVMGNQAIWLASLHPKKQRDTQQLLESLGTLYVQGANIDWHGFDKAYSRKKVSLPTYPFQRQRYWVDNRTKTGRIAEAGHPLIGTLRRSPTSEEIHFQTKISVNHLAYLKDHRVFEQSIFPGAAYLEMALAAGKDIFTSQTFYLSNITFQHALLLTDEDVTLDCVFTPLSEGYRWQIFSLLPDQQEWLLHSTGEIHVTAHDIPRIELATLKTRCSTEVLADTHYQTCAEQGLDYGVEFQGIEQLYQGNGEALGLIELSESLKSDADNYQLHPALLDACLQVSLVAMSSKTDETYLPFAVESVTLYVTDNPRSMWSYAKIRPVIEPTTFHIDITLFNEIGDTVAEIVGLTVRPAHRGALLGSRLHTDWLYQLTWQQSALPKQSPYAAESGNWLIIGDQTVSQSLADLLQAQGERVDVVSPQQLYPLTTAYRSIVYLGGLSDNPQNAITSVPSPDYFPTLDVVRKKLQATLHGSIDQITFYNEFMPQIEALSGAYIVRALQELGVDFSPTQRFSRQQLIEKCEIIERHQRLFERLLAICAEEKIFQQDSNECWEVVSIPESSNPESLLLNLSTNYPQVQSELTLLGRCGKQLAGVLQGKIDPLELLFPSGDLSDATQLYRESPGARVMNILMQTTVKLALEELPQNRRIRILEVGGGTGSTTGYLLPYLPANQTDYVFSDISPFFLAQAKEQFKNYPFVRYQSLDLERPVQTQGFELEQYDLIIAANVVHATADLHQSLHALHTLLAPGGRLCLLEVSGKQRWLDLTFGLTEGWWRFTDTLLRPDYPLLSSTQWHSLLQDCDFDETLLLSPEIDCETLVLQTLVVAQKPMRNVEVEKIDTALSLDTKNSIPEIAHKHATQALQWIQAIIRAQGQPRLWLVTQEAIGERITTRSISTSVLWGIGRTVMWEHPQLQCSCLDLSANTSAQTLFETVWYADAENQLALRQGQRQIARLQHPKSMPKPEELKIRSDSSYLIVGGLGGVGLKIAQWLVEQGARYLILSSRHGADETAQAIIHQLESAGATILVMKSDISQESDVAQLLTASQQLAPLRGIIHSAGVLDDGILLQQTSERFANVFAPKVAGSWHLHHFSQEIPLDFFVCFSSIASLLGHGGQANHAAANAFQDALVYQRKQMGLPALSINWGGWSEVGAAANLGTDDMMSPEQGVSLFGYLLNQSVTQMGVLPIRWSRFAKQLPGDANFPLLTQFLKSKTVTTASVVNTSLRHQWLQTKVNQREDFLKQQLRREIAVIIGVEPTDSQSFFDLGMDSLLSIQLSTRLESALEVSLPATVAFEYNTIEKLTRYLTELLNQSQNSKTLAQNQEKRIPSRLPEQKIPLSFAQQKVWVRQQASPTANLYNLSDVFRLVGAVNVACLKQALKEIEARHEVLRTTYTSTDGEVGVHVSETSTGNMQFFDISHLPEPEQSEEARRLTLETTLYPFNLREQTWRVALIKTAENNHLFILCMHHIIMDAWSVTLFFTELSALYAAFSQGESSPLSPLEIQYADFACWQRQYFTAERLASRLAYWQNRLANASPLLELPIDKPRPTSGQFYPGNIERFSFSPALSQQVKAFSLQTGKTLYVTLLSAYMTLLNQRTGCQVISLMSPVNKRDSQALEPLIGHFSDMAVLWIDLCGNPTFEELQQRTYDMVLEAINQQDVPLEQVVETLLSGENLTENLPYRVSFNFRPTPQDLLILPDIQIEKIVLDEAEQGRVINDMALAIWEENEGEAVSLCGFLRYRTDLFEAKTIRQVIADFEVLLTQVVTNHTLLLKG